MQLRGNSQILNWHWKWFFNGQYLNQVPMLGPSSHQTSSYSNNLWRTFKNPTSYGCLISSTTATFFSSNENSVWTLGPIHEWSLGINIGFGCVFKSKFALFFPKASINFSTLWEIEFMSIKGLLPYLQYLDHLTLIREKKTKGGYFYDCTLILHFAQI